MTWPPKWSDECSKGGSGECDGFDYRRGQTCNCPCHTDTDLPMTVPLVRDWHDEMHGHVREEQP